MQRTEMRSFHVGLISGWWSPVLVLTLIQTLLYSQSGLIFQSEKVYVARTNISKGIQTTVFRS